jgi:acyl-CoA thioesterase-2
MHMQEALDANRSPTSEPSQATLDQLIDILDLEELELNLFRGRSPQEDTQRVFGGQVAGQALVAAGRTVEDRHVHSLHSYFLRAGDPRVPIIYQVDRLRDGRSFATRRVTAIQQGRAIFALAASFQVDEESDEHQADMPETPAPESLPGWDQHVAEMEAKGEPIDDWMRKPRPIDTRVVDSMDYAGRVRQDPFQRVWLRADGVLPDDPLLHQCVAAYASDMTLLDTAARPHLLAFDDDLQLASLDHAMWFHRPFRADEWLLYAQESPNMSNSRGFTTARFYARDGRLVVSVAQEGLFRRR